MSISVQINSEDLNQNGPGGAEPTGADAVNAVDAKISPLPRDDFDRDVWCVMGLPIDVASLDGAVTKVDAAIRENKRLSLVTPNVNWLVRARNDANVRQQILEADLSIADGAPLALMARLLKAPIGQRTAGSDVFEALRRRPGYADRAVKVFFFGGRDGAGGAAMKAVNAYGGGVRIVGALNPGHGDVESMSSDEIIGDINDADADFVIVALGAAKGQAWIEHNKERLAAPVVSHLGAVIDFAGGGIQRAPMFFQKTGLEWLWRIKEEPGLWKRYFDDGRALIGLAVTSLAPQLFTEIKLKNVPATVERNSSADKTALTLAGDLVRQGLGPVRDAFRQMTQRTGDVYLDLSSAGGMDRAFLGLVMMLEKHLARRNAEIVIVGASPAIKAMLKVNAMTYRQTDIVAPVRSQPMSKIAAAG